MAQHTQLVEQLGYSGEELRLAAIDVHLPPSSGESNTDKFHGCAKKRFARMFYDQTYSIISDYHVRKIKSDFDFKLFNGSAQGEKPFLLTEKIIICFWEIV